jgi:hypothetical protein
LAVAHPLVELRRVQSDGHDQLAVLVAMEGTRRESVGRFDWCLLPGWDEFAVSQGSERSSCPQASIALRCPPCSRSERSARKGEVTDLTPRTGVCHTPADTTAGVSGELPRGGAGHRLSVSKTIYCMGRACLDRFLGASSDSRGVRADRVDGTRAE